MHAANVLPADSHGARNSHGRFSPRAEQSIEVDDLRRRHSGQSNTVGSVHLFVSVRVCYAEWEGVGGLAGSIGAGFATTPRRAKKPFPRDPGRDV